MLDDSCESKSSQQKNLTSVYVCYLAVLSGFLQCILEQQRLSPKKVVCILIVLHVQVLVGNFVKCMGLNLVVGM